jgi:ABC-2 type transport system permease protein
VSVVGQVAVLGTRAFLRSSRQPGQLFFALAFPLFFLAVIASGLNRADTIPGFPDDSFLDFMMVVPFVHGALFTAINSAVELGRDIETGFLNRLALTPARGIAIMLGNLAGAVAMAMVQFSIYFVATVIAGAEFEAGWLGIPVLFGLAAMIAIAFGAAGMTIALRTGSSDGVQGMFPLFFVVFFLSSMNMPRDLIDAEWFRWIATVNPVSYLIEGLRSLAIWGWDPLALALGFGTALGVIAIALTLSAFAFQERLTRT